MIRIVSFVDEELFCECCRCGKKSGRSLNSSRIKLLRVWFYGSCLVDGSIHETLSVRHKIKRLCLVILKESMIEFFVWCDRSNPSLYVYNTAFCQECSLISSCCSESVAMHIGYRNFFVFFHEFCQNPSKLVNNFWIFFMERTTHIKININNHSEFLQYSFWENIVMMLASMNEKCEDSAWFEFEIERRLLDNIWFCTDENNVCMNLFWFSEIFPESLPNEVVTILLHAIWFCLKYRIEVFLGMIFYPIWVNAFESFLGRTSFIQILWLHYWVTL